MRSLVFLLAAVVALAAQEYRATLLGLVSDPSGAAVAGARVAVTNLASGLAVRSESNQTGNYVAPFLLPGSYRLEVEKAGFKTFERSPLELRVNDRLRLDVRLEIGEVSERVTITAEAPLLETSTSSRGQVIESRQITDLPIGGKNPFMLMGLAAGVQFAGSLQFARPFDVGSSSDVSINGGRRGVNEFQIDGISDNVGIGARPTVAYVPPVEATQEFKVQTNTYDAQYGRTGGGIISVSVKPGTNAFHGAAYEYLRRTGLEANTFANNAYGRPRTERTVDQYGFEIDGPLTVPKLYRGQDRTFFMFALERLRDSLPMPALGTVPTAEQRKGDFSQTLTSSGRPYTIYDPLSVTPNPAFDPAKPVSLANLQYLRSPFAGNQVPAGRRNAIAPRVLEDIPLPNRAGDPVTRLNNWYAGDVAQDEDFQNLIARVDHALSGAWRLYARWSHNYRDGGRINYSGWETPARRQIHAGRGNDGAVFDAVGTLSPHTILSARLGFGRFKELSKFIPQDLSALGFPKSLAAQLQIPNKYPLFSFEGYMPAGLDEWDIKPSDTYTAQTTLLKILGRHSLKTGFEFRLIHTAIFGRANASGAYNFTRAWTGSNPQVNDPAAGNAVASFLLGYLSSANATLNATPYLSVRYPVWFFQDDWQVSPRLTLNLGLRWDSEGAPRERYNRQNRGFDFAAQSPYQAPGLDLHGGLLFAGTGGQARGAFDPDRNNWQPRLGLAYRLLASQPLVFRAGLGRNFLPTVEFGGTIGFSQTTNALTGTPEFLPFHTLSDPFPNGLIQPPGASRGLATQVGDSLSFSDSRRRIPDVWQFSAGFQYELRTGLLVEAGYVGSRTRRIQISRALNYLTKEQLALGTPYLSESVANPFYGVLPANTSRGAQPKIQRRNLLLQYPHFTGVTMNNTSLGESWYDSLQAKLEQRLRGGLAVLASYTVSKTMEAAAYKNAPDTELSRDLVVFDVPQRLVVSGVYEFPVGPKKRWFSRGLAAHLVGGWQLGFSGVMQSGMPMSYPDYYIYGNPKLASGQSLNRWFDTSLQIWVQRPADTLRTAPLRSPNLRRHTAPQVDATLIRSFRLREGQRVEFKVSAFNLSNTPVFDFPNTDPNSPLFGVVPATQLNSPRSIELGLRYVF